MAKWKSINQKIINNELRAQHNTTATKVAIAEYHLRKLISMFPTKRATDLLKLSYDTDTKRMQISVFGVPQFLEVITPYEYFLYSLRSCVDSFLLEVNRIYDLNIPSSKVNLWRIKKELLRQYSSDELTKHIVVLIQSEWFKYLTKLRNFVAHHTCSSLITSSDYGLYLPDDPDSSPNTIKKNFDFFAKLSELLKETMEFLETGYSHLEERLK
jgi:hypothetical protein